MTSNGLRFKDKVVIVTGGCSGIGRGCVDLFVENGGQVAVLDINDEIGNSLKVTGPGEIYYIHCDITNEEQLKNAISATHKKFGRIDCLINNAGRHPGFREIDTISTVNFRKLVDLNLVAHFVACRYKNMERKGNKSNAGRGIIRPKLRREWEALPYLRQTKGSIISISSMSGVLGQGRCIDYCATKGAIGSMTRSLAIEESKYGVRVNAVAPGGVKTPLMKRLVEGNESLQEEINNRSLLQRCGDVREVAKACLYLAVDATYTTGDELHCSGGADIGYGLRLK